MANDDVTKALAGARQLEVDVAHLGNIATYLTTVADAISTIRDSTLRLAHRAATMGGEAEGGRPSSSALGSTEIRPHVEDLSRREQQTFTAVDGSLKSIADNLRKTAEGVTEIAEQYQTVEDRNAASAQDWARAISGSNS
jgi:methyl-accepting chemotaxis protein